MDESAGGLCHLAGFTCFYCLPGESPAKRFQCLSHASPRSKNDLYLLIVTMPASQCMAVEVQDGIHRLRVTAIRCSRWWSSPASDATDCEAHPRSSPRCSQAPRRDLRHPAEAPAVVPVSTPSWDQAVLATLSRSDVRYFTSAAIPRTRSATTSKPQRRRCHVGEFYLSIESVCRRPSGTKATPYAGARPTC